MKAIAIYFGDKRDPFVPGKYCDFFEAFGSIQKNLCAESLSFLHQTHSVSGQCCNAPPSDVVRFAGEGDFLITNRPGAAIGVLTADCLPIVLHDEKKHACGVIHAGWRGSVAGIAVKALQAMGENFGCEPRSIKAYFGPAASKCCYEVDKNFYKNVAHRHIDDVFIAKDDRFFFDNYRLNKLQLMEVGVLEGSLINRYNLCTICSGFYHSYRRDKDRSRRQATVVVLR